MLWLMGLSFSFAETGDVDPSTAQQQYIEHNLVLTAIQSGNAKTALKESQNLEKSISCPQRVPLNDQLANLWVHRGYVYQLQGKDEQLQEAWAQAFAMSPDIQLDQKLLDGMPEAEQENLLNRFEQIRRLVEGQGVMDPSIPEQLGEAKVFINGRSLTAGQGVKPGQHLAQIVCPDDGLQSQWTDFSKPLDWFEMCPSGVDTSAAPAEEDFFGGGLFGDAQEDTAQYYNPEPVCTGGQGLTLPSFSMPSVSFPEVDPTVLVTMGSGVGLVLAGTGSFYVWAKPAHDNVVEARILAGTNSITQAEANAISKKFNVARYSTLGLLAAGTTLTGYGTILTIQNVSMMPTWTPGWIGLNGQF